MNKTVLKRLLIAMVIFGIFYVYIVLYTKVPDPPYTIVQVTLDKLTPDILQEKQPVLVNDRIVNIDALLKTVFAYMYMFSDERFLEPSDKFSKTTAKYTIFTSPFWDTNIDIADPSNLHQQQSPKYITIKLHQNKVLIMPSQWLYRITDKRIKRILLDDILSIVGNKLTGKA